MLVRVPCNDVVLGMFVHSMEGSWLDHPFWRRRFLLSDPRDLARLKASPVPAVLIDPARGVAPAGNVAAPARPAPPPAPATIRMRATARPATPPRDARSEVADARRVIRRSKQAVMRLFADVRLGKAVTAAAVTPLVAEIAESVARNPFALLGIARLKTKDEYTYLHSVAVCALMINLARTLELDEAQVREAGLAGLLHDVGKMAVPDAILTKPDRLDDAEFALVREHPRRGYEILAAGGDVPAAALDVCLHHHEKIDGNGYPDGLAGDAIGLFARMGAICDVYDAITSERSYKDAWEPGEAIGRMLGWDGHFDPVLLAAFIRSVGIYPVGTLVRLRSNRLAIVVAENAREPTRPRLRAFYSVMDRAPVPPEDLVPSATLRGDQIVSRELPEHWHFDDWDALSARIVAGGAP